MLSRYRAPISKQQFQFSEASRPKSSKREITPKAGRLDARFACFSVTKQFLASGHCYCCVKFVDKVSYLFIYK